MLLYWNSQNAVLAFSFAQLASVIAYTMSFYVYFWYYTKKNKKDFPFKQTKKMFGIDFAKFQKMFSNYFFSQILSLFFFLKYYSLSSP